jgi:hypothetical protein
MWGAQAPVRAPAPLISFKAGKMRTTPIENRFRVEADDRRGLLSLEKGQDGAIHFLWKDRQTLQAVDDFLVFPGDQTLEKVDTGRPEDRIYLLTFKTSADRRFFFWMQEPDVTKDEERVKDFNRFMNDVTATAAPPSGGLRGLLSTTGAGGLSGVAGGSSAAAPIVGLDELSNILSGLGYTPSEADPAGTSTEEPTSASNPEGESGMDVEGSDDSGAERNPPADKKDEAPFLTEDDLIRALEGPTMTPNLARILNGDALDALLEDADEDVVNTLISLLPEGRQTDQELRMTFRSPQLRQTLVQLSKALNSENINMVIMNFGLDARAGANLLQIGDGIGAFLAALEAEVENEPSSKPGVNQ